MNTHLDLFSGIGGFALGLDKVGEFEHTFVEYEPHLQRVLKKNFPNSRIHGDITNFTPEFQPWVITGGFPCQDISRANTNKNKGGINGNRSGLWKHYLRVIRECFPKYIIIENVYDLLSNGLGVIVQDLAKIGYDSTWTIIDSRFCGVPQRRRRIYILGFRDGITTGTDPLDNSGRSGDLLRRKIKQLNDQEKNVAHSKTHGVEFYSIQKTGMYRRADVCSTIRKCGWATGGDLIVGDDFVRHLTYKEKLKLQGFPENFTEGCGLNKSQLHSANGMTVPAVSWVAKQLISYDERLDIQK